MSCRRHFKDLPLGKILNSFSRINKNSTQIRFQIRVIDDKIRAECLNLGLTTFLRDEPLCAALNILSDKESLSTILTNWNRYIDEGVSLACYAEDKDGNPGELVSIALCEVIRADDASDDFDNVKGEGWRKILKVFLVMDDLVNVFKYYKVNEYFSINVVTVAEEHRGLRIGAEMFYACEALAKALKLEVISTVATAMGSQIIAAKCGYDTLCELLYKDMLEHGVDLTNCITSKAISFGKKL